MASTRTLALVVEYDGTRYHGFARQPEAATVAGALDAVLSTLHGHPIEVVCAGRTDAGVHATGQVVSYETNAGFPLERLAIAASALLGQAGIAVLRAVERDPGFSAWRDATSRTYRYRILNRLAPSPLLAKRAFHVRARLDVDAMRDAAVSFVGEHDFVAFCASLPERGPTVRTLTRCDVERSGEFVELTVSAASFLHQMVRIMAGTLIEVARGRRPVADVARLIRSGRRADAGFTAPAHALYLTGVEYKPPL